MLVYYVRKCFSFDICSLNFNYSSPFTRTIMQTQLLNISRVKPVFPLRDKRKRMSEVREEERKRKSGRKVFDTGLILYWFHSGSEKTSPL